jgi:hypothetical protein
VASTWQTMWASEPNDGVIERSREKGIKGRETEKKEREKKERRKREEREKKERRKREEREKKGEINKKKRHTWVASTWRTMWASLSRMTG